ncbi:MAG: amino acid adenylation domain-containing protein, partial [Actinobacteria bacterium]|nr:amino acid adenylation domain-containing protein [Actinomycetota bacterium]
SKEIDFLHTHLLNIIADAIAHPEKKLYEIDLLSPDEYKNVTVEFNGSVGDEGHRNEKHHSLLSLWEERVSETPDAQALIFHNNRLSVRELDKRSTALAQRLISLGIQADEAVALMLPRSDSYVVAMLGILKSGGAFLPVDLAWPQERIDYMLADCSVRFAVCEQPSRVPQGVQVVDWRALNTRAALPEVSPDSLAYLIYTSGSTGQPKGVMIEHHSIAHFAHVMRELWNGQQEGRMLCAGPTSFDLNVMEIVIGLLGNSTLVIADEDCANFPKQLCALIREHNINKMMVTPGRMELLLGSPEGETVLRGFEKIGLGADVLTPSLLARVQAHTNAQIVNYYGPTEVTICATCCDVTDVREANIGRPLPGVQAYILDSHLNPAPIGVPGELYVGGKGLARGYVGKEELTRSRFIPSPFIPGETLYRTGDLCRWYPRGEILFLGRIDQQVKIRGYRIELGEIENKLLEIEGVQSCAVICREDIEDRKSLCAYVVGENLPSASKIKALLSKDLPSYMVPSYFVALPLLPLTSNDKLDKKSLPAPQDAEGLLREEFEPPITDTEEGLALIWETILGIGEVGRNGNFFDLGGD